MTFPYAICNETSKAGTTPTLSDRVPTRLPGIGGRPLRPGARVAEVGAATGGAAAGRGLRFAHYRPAFGCWPGRRLSPQLRRRRRCVSHRRLPWRSSLAVRALVGLAGFGFTAQRRVPNGAEFRNKALDWASGQHPQGRADFADQGVRLCLGAAFTVETDLSTPSTKLSR